MSSHECLPDTIGNDDGDSHMTYDQLTKNIDKEFTSGKNTVQRDQWKNRIDFLIACMGLSIGLGNVWRFPYLCYKNGGGIGYACTMINFLLNCYYTVIMAWSFHFIFSSFTSELPWTKCGQLWNTLACTVFTNQKPVNVSLSDNTTASQISNRSVLAVDATTEYWENRVLRISDGIDNLGTIQWDLALCLLLTWIIIYLCICKGIRTSAKIMYVTALLPYAFIITLLIRTALLEGAGYGLIHYLKPDWSKLTDMTVWSDAGTQIFFSYSIGLGVLNAFGSYNRFQHNSFRDCVLFAVANTCTSLLSGCVIFATLGYMAYTSNIPLNLIAESGPGLGFVVYPKAIGTMPGSPFWSICFFTMIILLGIDSMILFIISVIIYEELTYKRVSTSQIYHFPGWAVKSGWLMASTSVLLIPLVMVVKIIKTPGTFIQTPVISSTQQEIPTVKTIKSIMIFNLQYQQENHHEKKYLKANE
ncbi:unnamed protein product [Heterobilharzia americana]|nr:unnamed protein product [Heterobilharzia americana]